MKVEVVCIDGGEIKKIVQKEWEQRKADSYRCGTMGLPIPKDALYFFELEYHAKGRADDRLLRSEMQAGMR